MLNIYLNALINLEFFKGMRMGKLTSKLGLALVLSKFNVELADKTMADTELEFHPVQFILCPLKEFNLKITPRSVTN